MNDHSLRDPQLQFIEARIAAVQLHVSELEQQELLYRCAFEAGRKTFAKKLRYWQTFTLALLVLSCATSVPLVRDRLMPARRHAESNAPVRAMARQELGPSHSPFLERQLASFELDAWQLQPSDNTLAGSYLVQTDQIDPHTRSLTLGSLTREFLDSPGR
jgi:hypothetical protein